MPVHLTPLPYTSPFSPRRMASDDDAKSSRNDSLIGNLMGYIDTRIDLIKLEAQEKAKLAFVGAAHGITLALIGLLFIISLNIFAGLALNHVLNSTFWGFGIVAGFYLVLLIVFLVGVDKKIFQGVADKLLDNTIYKSDKRQA